MTDTGEAGGRLVGVVAGRDVDFVGDRRGTHLRDVMTTCAPWQHTRAQHLVAAFRPAGRRGMQQCGMRAPWAGLLGLAPHIRMSAPAFTTARHACWHVRSLAHPCA